MSRFRAIAIKRPTTDMTGKYICEVTTSLGQDSEEAQMVIFVPPNLVSFSSSMLKEERKLVLTYAIERVYPLPEINVSRTCSDLSLTPSPPKEDKSLEIIHKASLWPSDSGADLSEEGTYSLQHVQYIDFTDLDIYWESQGCEKRAEMSSRPLPVTFQLNVRIPFTGYHVLRQIELFPPAKTEPEPRVHKYVGDSPVSSSPASPASPASSHFLSLLQITPLSLVINMYNSLNL
jgi:hypothetical protein